MGDKIIKDPVYGYISIDEEIVHGIIDKPEFQRLRYIRQTSYLPVYPAALHNRFTHSLGVYHLGKTAFLYIKNSLTSTPSEIDIERIEKIFILACLLHDIGHAPFSHSGESFYLKDENNSIIDNLKKYVDDEMFTRDLDLDISKGKQAAPHEIMSAILGIKCFSTYFNNSTEKSLFARCITGHIYKSSDKKEIYSFFNAIISLLNSSTIDVDRMDYLIRDAFVMGYNSISIDYNRLLSSLMIIKTQNDGYCLAFNKSALSVIENVIYAHDIEKKWVQSHPVILYESFLINYIIQEVSDYYKKHTNGLYLFSLESILPSNNDFKSLKDSIYSIIDESLSKLSENATATELANQLSSSIESISLLQPINLLCDDDIIYIAKKINSLFSQELFDRSLRRHPLWKSESEYKIFVDGFIGNKGYDKLIRQLKIVDSFLIQESSSHCIDQNSLDFCMRQLKSIEADDNLSDLNKDNMRKRYNLLIHWLKGFYNISEEFNLKFSFVIINANNFESGFKKIDLKNLQVFFPNTNCSYNLSDLINLFDVKDNSRREYFYLYCQKNDSNEKEMKVDLDKLGREISKLVLGDY